MLCISNAFRRLEEFSELSRSIKANRTPAVATGLSHIHKAAVIQTLCRDLDRRALVVVADESEAVRFQQDLSSMGARVALIPARDLILRDVAGVSREYEQARLAGLIRMLEKECDIAVCSVDAARMLTIPPKTLAEKRFTLKAGDSLPPAELSERLIAAGYTRCDMVEGAGQFATRGDILDLFAPENELPYRIEFWGDEIDSISLFDPLSQRRTDSVDLITVSPATEVLLGSAEDFAEKIGAVCASLSAKSAAKQRLTDVEQSARGGVLPLSPDRFLPLVYEPASIFDYAEGWLTVVSESARMNERCRSFDKQMSEEIKGLFESGHLCKGLDRYTLETGELDSLLEKRGTLFLDTFARGSYGMAVRTAVNFTMRQLSVWNGTLEQLKEDALPLIERGFAIALLAGTERTAKAVCDDLRNEGIKVEFVPDGGAEPIQGGVTVACGTLSAGMELTKAKFALFTHGQVASRRKAKYKKSKDAVHSLDELRNGDYVVHAAHGIGVFEGVRSMTVDGVTKDYIRIHYAKEDVLYVPVTQLDLVSKYIGNTELNSVRLNRLGGAEWQKTRARVKTAVRDMAKELIALYAERMARDGFAFSPDSDFQAAFESRFEYEETDDQLRCVSEIKRDMEQTAPMDRLLCGDVGFGKTEVALRAAFKCICDGKQCALLVPTTILAWQHYQTALRRMEGMPVTVELLTRFRTPKQQTDILRRLRSGEIDLIIGTHKLIAESVKFRDLGLLIIDEEQRFGVAQKEKLRKFRPNVDTLTLSATPIPRTLNMAMSGLRDMSGIDEAPGDRYPVQTYVLEQDNRMLLDAMRRELRRGGQVYYLHNRVDNIDLCAGRIAQELPEARVAVAHGKMSEEALSEVWRSLIDGEIDILVCTTIIETGVDVANVNTLIIEDADRMGLAQLHQLRGRVGRSNRRAYAYLTFRAGKALSDIAQKRLEAIREFTEFGSGLKIAMRDLEIRGAGNILGGEQHGHMDSVGYDMYIRLLTDAIQEEKGEKPAPDTECTIDLHIGAHIPESYISSLPARLGIYRRIADIRHQEDSQDVIDELIDRFGEPPESVLGLIRIALLRNRCVALGILSVEQKGDCLHLYPNEIDQRCVAALSAQLGRLFRLNAGAKPYYEVRAVGTIKPMDMLEGLLEELEKAVK